MINLADVNVLLALAWQHHPAHARAKKWLGSFGAGDVFATCAITELGFVRISLQPAFGATDISMVKQALAQVRVAAASHTFLSDAIGADALPGWVKTAKATTDGHLAALAAAHGARLVTFDAGIPGAVLV